MSGNWRPIIRYRHWWPRLLGVWGFTFGRRIYFARPREKVTLAMLQHECVHVEQFARYGLIGFPLRWLWESVRASGPRAAALAAPLALVGWAAGGWVGAGLGAVLGYALGALVLGYEENRFEREAREEAGI